MAKDATLSLWSVPLMVAWLSMFCDYLLMTCIIPLFPVLGFDVVATGILFSSKALMQILFAPLFSRVIDQHPLGVLVIGLLIDIIATTAFAVHVNYWTWLVARSLQGFASAAVMPAANGLVQRAFASSEEVRTEAFGVSTSGILGGVVLGPPLGGLLFSINPALPFASVTVLLVLTFALTVYLLRTLQLPPIEQESREAAEPPGFWHGFYRIRVMLKDKYIRRPMGALFYANAGIAALEATFGGFAMQHMGLTTSEVGLMYMWTTLPSISATFISPLIHTRFAIEKWKLIRLGLVVQGAFFILGPKSSILMTKVSFTGLGFGMGTIDGICNSLNAEISDARHRGTTTVHSLSTMAIQSGFLVGPVVGSFVEALVGFWGMMSLLGLGMILYSPAMSKLAEDWRNQDADSECSPLVRKPSGRTML